MRSGQDYRGWSRRCQRGRFASIGRPGDAHLFPRHSASISGRMNNAITFNLSALAERLFRDNLKIDRDADQKRG